MSNPRTSKLRAIGVWLHVCLQTDRGQNIATPPAPPIRITTGQRLAPDAVVTGGAPHNCAANCSHNTLFLSAAETANCSAAESRSYRSFIMTLPLTLTRKIPQTLTMPEK